MSYYNKFQNFRGRGRGRGFPPPRPPTYDETPIEIPMPTKYKSKGKQTRDTERSQKFREEKGKEKMEDIKKEIDKTLFFGFSNEEKAVQGLQINTIKQAKVLPISTRVIGLAIQAMFIRIFQLIRNPPPCTVYEGYRVSLAQAELKLIDSTTSQVTPTNVDPNEFQQLTLPLDHREALLSCPINFNVIASAVNAIGIVDYGQQTYYPKLPLRAVPEASVVTFSNLRQTVAALADARTPREVRVRFYMNNPLPGAIWRGIQPAAGRRRIDFELDPVLVNPLDFWPDNYGINDFRDDIQRYMGLLNFASRKSLKYVNVESRIDFRGPGSRTCLMSNYMHDDLKNADPVVIDGNIDWAHTSYPVGDLSEFWSPVDLEDSPMFIGMLQLLGEVPDNLTGNPSYRVRTVENSSIRTARSWAATFINMMG